MASSGTIRFGPFEVTQQVFIRTEHSFGLVNLKPLLPGHVLVCSIKPHQRLTDLSQPEITDLFGTVQRVQRMLAWHYFQETASTPGRPVPGDGSFNIAVQDGAEGGQTVPHVHVHIIPRIRHVTAKDPSQMGDELYEKMAVEDGNLGGALWDRELGSRPRPGGGFPRIEDCEREARRMDDMVAEVGVYKRVLREMEEARVKI